MSRYYLNCFLFNFAMLLNFSCVLDPEKYDPLQDEGTYRGPVKVYQGAGMDPEFIDRTCPEILATLTFRNGEVRLRTQDTYPNYTHVAGVVTDRTGVTSIYGNNRFVIERAWAIEETDVQLLDLMNLKVCEATPPSIPGDASTGDRGLLQDFAMRVDEPGLIGEIGGGIARGSLFYGVRCTDGTYIPICVYFMNLPKL